MPAVPARGVAAYTAMVDELGQLTISVLVTAGQAPRMQVGGLDSKPLTPAEWTQVHDAIASAWSDCRVRCACKHRFGHHGADSPHACQVKDCACAVFSAAEPFFRPDLDKEEEALADELAKNTGHA